MQAQLEIDHLDTESQYQFDEFVAALEDEAEHESRQVHDPAQLLVHPHPKARLTGAMMCYERTSPELKRLLVERLMLESHPFVRASLVKALRHYAEAPIIELLAECLHDPDSRVRSNTVEALMQYEHPSLFKRISSLLKDPDTRVRGKVLVYMAHRFPEKIRPLVETMASSGSSWTRRTAQFVFRSLGWRGPVEPAPSEGARDVLDMFANHDYKVRIQAVWRAQQMERDERSVLMRDQLEKEQHPHVIATLTRALGSPGQTGHISVLSRFLESRDHRIRANTVEGIGKIGGTAALYLIEPLLRDSSQRVRAAAQLYTGKLRRQRHQELMRSFLDATGKEELTASLLELARMPAEDSGRVLKVLSQAWDLERRRSLLPNLLEINLHGPGQDLLDRLRVLCRETPRQAEGAARVPRGAVADVARMGAASDTPPRDQALAQFGVEVVRMCENGELPYHGLIAGIAAIHRAEEALLSGVRSSECALLRTQLLVKLGRDAVGLSLRGELDSHRLRQRVEALRTQIGDIGSGLPEDNMAMDASVSAILVPQNDAPPVAQPPRRRLGRRAMVGLVSSVCSLAIIVGAAYRADILPKLAGDTAAVVAPKPIRPSPRAPSDATRVVTRTGKIIEIRNDGQWIVLEDNDRHYVLQFAHVSPVEPRIGERLEMTGSLSGKDADGREVILGESFRDNVKSLSKAPKAAGDPS